MSLSKEEAALALDAAAEARARTRQVTNYSYFAPYFLIWGVVWTITNGLSEFVGGQIAGLSWPVVSIGGSIACVVLEIVRAAHRAPSPLGDMPWQAQRWRFAQIWLAIVAFLGAVFLVLPALGWRQQVGFITLAFDFGFMLAGVWMGWRLFVIGLAATILVATGFVFVHEHFFGWMMVFSGGGLIAGGLWLRKA